MKVRVAYSGRSYPEAASLPGELELPPGATLAAALSMLCGGARPRCLSSACLVAISGKHVGSLSDCQDRELHENDEILLIAPVAGG
jgi:molybdopterin converting factor small subunit